MAVDSDGNVYVVYETDSNSDSVMDIGISRSFDGGNTWYSFPGFESEYGTTLGDVPILV